VGTAPSQGFDGLVHALQQHLHNTPPEQRTRRLAIIGRLLLKHMDDRLEAWGGQDFMHVDRHGDGPFRDATLMTQHGGIRHV